MGRVERGPELLSWNGFVREMGFERVALSGINHPSYFKRIYGTQANRIIQSEGTLRLRSGAAKQSCRAERTRLSFRKEIPRMPCSIFWRAKSHSPWFPNAAKRPSLRFWSPLPSLVKAASPGRCCAWRPRPRWVSRRSFALARLL